jgi:hypothetical protein
MVEPERLEPDDPALERHGLDAVWSGHRRIVRLALVVRPSSPPRR